MKHWSIFSPVSFRSSLPLVVVAFFAPSPLPANLRLSRICRFVAPLSCVLLCLGLISAFAAPTDAQAQANEWTWVGGSNTVGANGGQPGVYGTLGTPAIGNVPGGRFAPVTWTDASGDFWLFGGQGFDANGDYGDLNDLWEFSPSAKEWTWVAGSNTPSQPGVYGTLGTPAAGNVPGARYTSVSWTDGNGHLWLFGGGGFDSISGDSGLLNDLWEFDPSMNKWTWRSGSDTINQSGAYGVLGTPAAGNVPGGRGYTAVSWIDSSGNLWFFGGYGYDSTGTLGWLNDLWEFNPSTNQWTWRNGATTVSQPGVYGTLGTPAAGNAPGGRYAAVNWTDGSGDFWLFGGNGYEPDTTAAYLNDLWQFNPSNSEWTWKNGSSAYSQSGMYGTIGTPAAGNTPGGRNFASSWTDKSGNFWLFGGQGDDSASNQGYLNDLWEFNPSTNEWAWIGGSTTFSCSSSTCNPPGVYGTLGVAAAANIPGGRDGAVTWTDSTGNLWLFGGYGFDSTGSGGVLNDLWEYQPAPSPPPTAPIAQITPNPLSFIAISYGASETLPLNIENIGGGMLTLTSVPVVNGPSYKVIGNNCPSAGLIAQASCQLTIEFDPVTVGPHNDTMPVFTNGGNVVVNLNGTAGGVGTILENPLNFGTIPFGTTETLQLKVYDYFLNGLPTVTFSVSGPSYTVLPGSTCLAGIIANSFCTANIEFDPRVVGTHNDVLTVTPSVGKPSTVSLTGVTSGIGAEMEAPLNFGAIPFGTTETLLLTVYDVGISGPVAIGTAINGPSYKVLTTAQNTCLAGIAEGGSCTLPVEFDPASVGTHDDLLTLTPGGGAAPSTVRLNGGAN
jgi:N-acetylneuraminic acid mutarotase